MAIERVKINDEPTYELVNHDEEPSYPDWYYRGKDPDYIYSIDEHGANNRQWLLDRGTRQEGNKWWYPSTSKMGKTKDGKYFVVIDGRAFLLDQSPQLKELDEYDLTRRSYEENHPVTNGVYTDLEDTDLDAPKVGLDIHNVQLLQSGLERATLTYKRKQATNWNALDLLSAPLTNIPESTGIAIDKGLNALTWLATESNPLFKVLPAEKRAEIRANTADIISKGLTVLSPSLWIGSLASGFNYSPWDERNKGLEGALGVNLNGNLNFIGDMLAWGAGIKGAKTYRGSNYYKSKLISKAMDNSPIKPYSEVLEPRRRIKIGDKEINPDAIEKTIAEEKDFYNRVHDRSWDKNPHFDSKEHNPYEGVNLDISDLKEHPYGKILNKPAYIELSWDESGNLVLTEGKAPKTVKLEGYNKALKEAYDFTVNDVLERIRRGETREFITKEKLHELFNESLKEVIFKYEKNIGGTADNTGTLTINPQYGPSVELLVHELRHLLGKRLDNYFKRHYGLPNDLNIDRILRKQRFKDSNPDLSEAEINMRLKTSGYTGLTLELLQTLEDAYIFDEVDIKKKGHLDYINPHHEQMATNSQLRYKLQKMSGKTGKNLDEAIMQLSDSEILNLLKDHPNAYMESFYRYLEKQPKEVQHRLIGKIKKALVEVGAFTGGLTIFDKLYNRQ